MPGSFREFISTSTSPGIIIIAQSFAVGRAAELLHLLWAASEAEEYVNIIYDLP
jgi:Cft2 family RNA processing exonuclease